MVAVNRIGEEPPLRFYGSSFICDPYGRKLVQAPRDEPARADRRSRSRSASRLARAVPVPRDPQARTPTVCLRPSSRSRRSRPSPAESTETTRSDDDSVGLGAHFRSADGTQRRACAHLSSRASHTSLRVGKAGRRRAVAQRHLADDRDRRRVEPFGDIGPVNVAPTSTPRCSIDHEARGPGDITAVEARPGGASLATS